MSDEPEDFKTFMKAYPHFPGRTKRALTRGLWLEITNRGISRKVEGITIHCQATSAQLITAAENMHEDILRDYHKTDRENAQYVPGAQVWLGQARWEDWLPEEQIVETKLRAVE